MSELIKNAEQKRKEEYRTERRRLIASMKSARDRFRNDVNQLNKIIPSSHFIELSKIFSNVTLWTLYDGEPRMHIYITGDRKAFESAVREVARIVGEPPNVTATEHYFLADFTDSNVAVVIWPTDCKFIETIETKVIRKPHPSCVAALKHLEQVS